MTLLVTIATFNVIEVPLSLPGTLPFVLLSLQLWLGTVCSLMPSDQASGTYHIEGIGVDQGPSPLPLSQHPHPFSLQYNHQPVYQLQ